MRTYATVFSLLFLVLGVSIATLLAGCGGAGSAGSAVPATVPVSVPAGAEPDAVALSIVYPTVTIRVLNTSGLSIASTDAQAIFGTWLRLPTPATDRGNSATTGSFPNFRSQTFVGRAPYSVAYFTRLPPGQSAVFAANLTFSSSNGTAIVAQVQNVYLSGKGFQAPLVIFSDMARAIGRTVRVYPTGSAPYAAWNVNIVLAPSPYRPLPAPPVAPPPPPMPILTPPLLIAPGASSPSNPGSLPCYFGQAIFCTNPAPPWL